MLDCKHILGAVASAFAETLWPTRCVGCNLPGTLLCSSCSVQMPAIDPHLACTRCGAPYGHVVCTECSAGDFPFTAAHAAYSFEGVAKRVLHAYKDQDERRLRDHIAAGICQAARGAGGDWAAWADVLVTIPANPKNLRRRGFDHMADIARICAQELDLPLLNVLKSTRAADQRRLSAAQRSANRQGSFELVTSTDEPVVLGADERGSREIPHNEMKARVPASGMEGPVVLAVGRERSPEFVSNEINAHTPASNMEGAREINGVPCALSPSCQLRARNVLLIDDVLTTGATLSAATDVLLAAGAAEVRVAVFARVW